MIVDAFLSWSQRAPLSRRLDAADALARSFLHSQLSEDDRAKVRVALFVLLDDPAVGVRQRLAHVFADRRDAPRGVVLKLIEDVPAVATPLYARSPLLMRMHLRDGLARQDLGISNAIAARFDMGGPLVDRLIADGPRDACLTLVGNGSVNWTRGQIDAFVDRFGDDSEALDAIERGPGLQPDQVCALIGRRAEACASNGFVAALVPAERLARLTHQTRERALASFLATLDEAGCQTAVRAAHGDGLLSPALIVRLALSGHVTALETVVAQLCEAELQRVRNAFVHPRPGVAAALLAKTGLAEDVRCILSMAMVLARELAEADLSWDPGFFSATLLEVIDQRFGAGARSAGLGFGGDDEAGDALLGLCHGIAADIDKAEALAVADTVVARNEAHMPVLPASPSSSPMQITDQREMVDQKVTKELEAVLAA